MKLEIDKTINATPQDIFNSIKHGTLFEGTGAIMNRLTFHFVEGGEVEVHWSPTDYAKGKIEKIVENSHISFSWNGHSQNKTNENTLVTINLKKIDDVNTLLTLTHDGLKTDQDVNDHKWGWENSVVELSKKLAH